MSTCAYTTSFLGCLVTLALFARYVLFADAGTVSKICFLIPALVVGCIPLLVGYNFENIFGKFYPVYRYGLYFIFIGAVILLTVTVIRDVLWLIGAKSGWFSPYSFHGHLKVDLYTLGLSLLLAAWALFEGVKVPAVKNVTIASEKISENKTIVVLSDLHIHRVLCPYKIRHIVARTNALKPDIILLAGDIIDDDTSRVADITALLKNLKAKDGIYFVTGNHEFYAGYQETVSALKELGFKFLENDGVSLGEIYLAGIPDTFTGQTYGKNADIKQAFIGARPGQYRLLMSHTPTDFKGANNFDLEIAGHTHGGQIFPFHIFTKLHNKYLSGLYPMDNNASVYVSNGAGQWGPQMRFLAPSEITVLNLVKEN